MPEQLSLLQRGRQFALQDLDLNDSIKATVEEDQFQTDFLLLWPAAMLKLKKCCQPTIKKKISTHQKPAD